APAGPKARWPDAADLRREFPQFRPGRLALLEEEAGFLRATDCVVALRGLAEKHGVRFVTGKDAAVEPGNRGVTVRVGTTSYHAPQIVVAAGGWAERVFSELGGAPWQGQQGIMYLEGVPEEVCRPRLPPHSGPPPGLF